MAVALINVTTNEATFVNQDFSALLAEDTISIDDFAAAVSASAATCPITGDGLAADVIQRLEFASRLVGDRVRGLLYLPLGRDRNSECYMVVEAQDAVFTALAPRSISQSYLAMALHSSNIGAWSLNVETQEAERTLSHDAIFGYDGLASHWDLDVFLSHVVEEERLRVRDAFQQAVSSRGTWNFTCRIRRLDGELRWIEASGYPRGPGDTTVTHYIGLVKDISAEINAAEQRRLLFAELHHRVRNNLAVMQSLTSSTFRLTADAASAAEALRRRITAMSDAHDLLLDASETPVTIRRSIEKVASTMIPRPCIRIRGGDGELSLSHVVPISMWVMELLYRIRNAQPILFDIDCNRESTSVTCATERCANSIWIDNFSEALVLNILPTQMGGKADLIEDDEKLKIALTIKPPAEHVTAPSKHTLTATAMLA